MLGAKRNAAVRQAAPIHRLAHSERCPRLSLSVVLIYPSPPSRGEQRNLRAAKAGSFSRFFSAERWSVTVRDRRRTVRDEWRGHDKLADLGDLRKNREVGRDRQSRGATGTLGSLDTETLPPIARDLGTDDPLVVGLTILCHPDSSRVGEQSHLQPLALGRVAQLCRSSPNFRHPGAPRGRPLADPFLSRRPLELRWRDDVLEIGGELDRQGLLIDGLSPDGVVLLDAEMLRDGVVVELAQRVALLLHLLPMPRRPDVDLGLVGGSEAIEVVRQEVLRVARVNVPVLLRGESGTGKELVARAIHQQSDRAAKPFVSVNMAAIPATTAVSGLFGHEKGAFTGATSTSKGFFGQAQGGTLFLDEIGDAPPELQVLLLRALESGEVQPVGAQSTRQVDVRVVAATESDLEAAVESGSFRPALLHRLAGYEIRVPSLRVRRDDVARLLIHFLRVELAEIGQSHLLGKPRDRATIAPLDPSDLRRLVLHDWPGNVRQLRNVARRIAIGSQGGDSLSVGGALDRLLSDGSGAFEGHRRAVERQVAQSPARVSRAPASITDEELVDTLRAVGFRPGPAAERLGIGRTTIYKLIDGCPAIKKATDLADDELRVQWLACGGDVVLMAERLEVSLRALKLRLRRFEPPDSAATSS